MQLVMPSNELTHKIVYIYYKKPPLQKLLKAIFINYIIAAMYSSLLLTFIEQNHHHLLPSEYQHLPHSVLYKEEKYPSKVSTASSNHNMIILFSTK